MVRILNLSASGKATPEFQRDWPVTICACTEILQDARVVANILEAIEICGEIGYEAVELSAPHVLESEVSLVKIGDFSKALGMSVYGIHNAVPADFTFFGEYGQINTQAKYHLIQAMKIVRVLGGRVLNLGVGSSRKLSKSVGRKQAKEAFLELISDVIENFSRNEITLSIEVISSKTADFFTSASETTKWVQRLRSPWVGITLDTFQANAEGLDIVEEAKAAGRYLSHIHLAEVDRRAPGSGSLDFRELMTLLAESRYRGAVSVELKTQSPFYVGAKDPIWELTHGLNYLQQTWASIATKL